LVNELPGGEYSSDRLDPEELILSNMDLQMTYNHRRLSIVQEILGLLSFTS